jgi:hypothetical protein
MQNGGNRKSGGWIAEFMQQLRCVGGDAVCAGDGDQTGETRRARVIRVVSVCVVFLWGEVSIIACRVRGRCR